jgi:hypothetical protein
MIEQQISQKLSEIQSEASDLDSITKSFISAAVRFFQQKTNEFVEEGIRSHPDKVKELGKAGLKPIKDQINRFIANSDDHVTEILDRKELWKHRQEGIKLSSLSFGDYMVHGNRAPDILDEAIKSLFFPIGGFLLEHGLTRESDWVIQAPGRARYKYALSWSEEMLQVMKSFENKFNEFYKLHEALDKLERKKSENEALDTWNSV